jgi:hypothetical protein
VFDVLFVAFEVAENTKSATADGSTGALVKDLT